MYILKFINQRRYIDSDLDLPSVSLSLSSFGTPYLPQLINDDVRNY